MLGITGNNILEATLGRAVNGKTDTPIAHMSFDSRKIEENTLYVPIIGEKVDGHEFIESAFKNGACAALIQKGHTQNLSAAEAKEKLWIEVEDTKKALQAIGAYYRKRLSLPIIGVTGSVGKTTTRAMIACALSAGLSVYQTKGNQNSQVGVPVMLTEIEKEQIAVLEMGMSEFGEMERLTQMVQPDLAVITCIGVAHIEQLKTKENICKEKMAITKGMKKEGILLLNGDDALLREQKGKTEQKVYYFGTHPDCDFRAEDIKIVNGKAEFEAVYQEDRISVALSMPGIHNVVNAMAALGCAYLSGVSMKAAADKLGNFEGIKMRQQIYQLSDYTIIDDSYNANPDSMKAGLQVLTEYPRKGRKIAVLGDMLELGEKEIEYHKEIGNFAASCKVDILLTFGELSKEIKAAYEKADRKEKERKAVHFQERKEIIDYLKQNLQKEDVILCKGSRGMALNQVAEALLKE